MKYLLGMKYSDFSSCDISEFKVGSQKENQAKLKENKYKPKPTSHHELVDLINQRKQIVDLKGNNIEEEESNSKKNNENRTGIENYKSISESKNENVKSAQKFRENKSNTAPKSFNKTNNDKLTTKNSKLDKEKPLNSALKKK